MLQRPPSTVPTLRVRRATPARWRDLETLFGPRGACAGCWWMCWRLPRAEFNRGNDAGNRRALKAIVASGACPGLLGYADRQPVAWCSIAPREGARLVEGYPVEPRGGRMPDVFVWTGLASAYLKAGFREVARRSPTRPIMRVDLAR